MQNETSIVQRKAQSSMIALVSTNAAYRDVVCEYLGDEGYHTLISTEAQHAYEVIYREQPALVLLDAWLEHPHAGEMLLAMLHITPRTRNIPVILCTTDVRCMRERAALLRNQRCEVVLIPVGLDDLLATITMLLCWSSTHQIDANCGTHPSTISRQSEHA